MEQKTSDDIVSTQKSLPPSQAPGWNDPPKWAYSPTPNACSSTKRVLNKRVAFPMSSANSRFSSDGSSNPTIPPVPNLTDAWPLLPDSNVERKLDKKQSLSDVEENFKVVLQGKISPECETDVQKKLELMRIAWLEDKLDDSARLKVLELSKALREGNTEEADKIHIVLTMHHNASCSSWISGVRQLILALKGK